MVEMGEYETSILFSLCLFSYQIVPSLPFSSLSLFSHLSPHLSLSHGHTTLSHGCDELSITTPATPQPPPPPHFPFDFFPPLSKFSSFLFNYNSTHPLISFHLFSSFSLPSLSHIIFRLNSYF